MPTRKLPPLVIAKSAPSKCRRTRGGHERDRRTGSARGSGTCVRETIRRVRGEMATSIGAKPTAGKRTLLQPATGPRIVVVGLDSEQPGAEDLRRAAGAGVRHAASLADVGTYRSPSHWAPPTRSSSLRLLKARCSAATTMSRSAPSRPTVALSARSR